jgi:hypothetical protein
MATKESLIAAISRIWKAPVYADGKREKGISVEMVDAIRRAALESGIIAEDTPLTPQLAVIDAELERLNSQGIYPKLNKDLSFSEIEAELKKLG